MFSREPPSIGLPLLLPAKKIAKKKAARENL